jgi:hypothetical protein
MSQSKPLLKKPKPHWPLRNGPRLPHLRELSLVYEGRNEVLYLHPPDISTQGMFINTPARYPEGTVLKLRFRLTRSGVEIFARGEVRYCLPSVGIGVQFLELPPKSARAIEKEIQRSGAARAARKR